MKKHDFPSLVPPMHGKPFIYLDSAATAHKPQVVIDALTNFYSKTYGTVHRAIYERSAIATQAYEAARETVRRFLNASRTEEIIFTRGTTGAINTVAYSLGKAVLHAGDEVLITETEHHANIVPWQMVCAERGAFLKVIPVDDAGELKLDQLNHLLSPKTKILSLSHIANSTGTLHPIKQIIKLAHQNGTKVFIDGAQAAPHLPVDVQDLDADFYAFSGHKAYGPTGVGVLYGKYDLLQMMPPHYGGGDMIETVTFEKTTYNKLPLKFEAGTPMIAEVIGLGAAISYLQGIGLDKIHHYLQGLLEYATQAMKQIPELRIIGTAKQKGAIISFVIDGIHPLDIGSMLDIKGIAIRTGHQCAQPTMKRFGVSAVCRISFGIYNTKEEIDQFIIALKEVIHLLRNQ